MIIITTINRFFIISKKNILLHSSKHFLSLMNRRTFLLFYSHLIRQFLITKFFNNILLHSSKHFLLLINWSTWTFLLFHSHLIRQFLITKFFNIILLHSSSRINRLSYLSHLMFSFIKSTTKLFWSMTLTIILQSISINLFYLTFSKTLMNRFFFSKT